MCQNFVSHKLEGVSSADVGKIELRAQRFFLSSGEQFGTLSERRPTIEPDSITQPRIERFFERLAVCPKHFHSDLLTIER